MNWRRGLLRLWVLLSAIWAVAVASVSYYQWYSDPLRVVSVTTANPFDQFDPKSQPDDWVQGVPATTEPNPHAQYTQGQQVTPPPGFKLTDPKPDFSSQSTPASEPPNKVESSNLYAQYGLPTPPSRLAPYNGPISPIDSSPAVAGRQRAIHTLGLALLPPMAALFIGIGLYWSLSGFRAR